MLGCLLYAPKIFLSEYLRTITHYHKCLYINLDYLLDGFIVEQLHGEDHQQTRVKTKIATFLNSWKSLSILGNIIDIKIWGSRTVS